jgi:hypothetical protein
MCTDCKRRPQDMTTVGPELCEVCLEYADHEIMHMDHDDPHTPDVAWTTADKCMICTPELDTRYADVNHGDAAKATARTYVRQNTSHINHGHALTPKARAACRKANQA